MARSSSFVTKPRSTTQEKDEGNKDGTMNRMAGNNSGLLPPHVNAKDKECDFYRSPTILSRLIQNFKYRAAVQRLERRGPAEASVWVCTKRKTEQRRADTAWQTTTAANSLTSSIISHSREGYGYRQLPIHMACESLFRVADQSLRADLESLIAHLVIAYPEGCSRCDHEGKLPLHEAIWHGASPETVSALLMAYPDASAEKDTRGRYPFEINEHQQGVHKAAIRDLLRRKNDFWAAAGQEAHMRLKHRHVRSAEASVTSTSVLASSVMEDDDTLVSSATFDISVDPTHPKAAGKYAAHVKALRWTQIEKRAMTLESKLAESYEQSYRIKQEVTELHVSKTLLQKKVDKLMKTDRAAEISELVMENEELRDHVKALQSRLSENDIPIVYESDHPETLHLPANPVSIERERNAQLARQLNETTADFAAYRQKTEKDIWELEKRMERIVAQKDDYIRALEEQLQQYTTTLQPYASKSTPDYSKSYSSDEETTSSTEGSSATPSTPEPHEEEESVDEVLWNAVRLNGGIGLSPRLVEMWNTVKLHAPTLGRISEDASYDKELDFHEQQSLDDEYIPSEDKMSSDDTKERACEGESEDDPDIVPKPRLKKSFATGSIMSGLTGGTDSLMVPALDHAEKEVRFPPSPSLDGLKQEVPNLTLSESANSGWTLRGKCKDETSSTVPMSKASGWTSMGMAMPELDEREVSEITMTVCGDGRGEIVPHTTDYYY